jgi:hypothetical protein
MYCQDKQPRPAVMLYAWAPRCLRVCFFPSRFTFKFSCSLSLAGAVRSPHSLLARARGLVELLFSRGRIIHKLLRPADVFWQFKVHGFLPEAAFQLPMLARRLSAPDSCVMTARSHLHVRAVQSSFRTERFEKCRPETSPLSRIWKVLCASFWRLYRHLICWVRFAVILWSCRPVRDFEINYG